MGKRIFEYLDEFSMKTKKYGRFLGMTCPLHCRVKKTM